MKLFSYQSEWYVLPPPCNTSLKYPGQVYVTKSWGQVQSRISRNCYIWQYFNVNIELKLTEGHHKVRELQKISFPHIYVVLGWYIFDWKTYMFLFVSGLHLGVFCDVVADHRDRTVQPVENRRFTLYSTIRPSKITANTPAENPTENGKTRY